MSRAATHAGMPSLPLPRQRPALLRLGATVLALVAVVAGGAIAWHYPVAPRAVTAAFFVAAALAFTFPLGWLAALFALLPVLGLAPWTGWITFEEVDLLVLASAAGGYARLALQSRSPARTPQGGRRSVSIVVWLLLALFAGSTLLAMLRGFDDAGGFSFGWFQGYHEPMNSVRLAKSFAFALLLVPLWRAGSREHPDRAPQWLCAGLVLGLIGAALATLWERHAFTGLLNASSDYRTTALFWEMHVGGAALDGFLALTVPFALAAMLSAHSARGWAFAAAALALAAYASLTTFSRGVYLAVPIGVAITLLLHWRSRQRAVHAGTTPGGPADAAVTAAAQGDGAHVGSALLLAASFGLAAFWMFPTSGWRGLLALLGVMAVWLTLAGSLARLKPAEWGIGIGLGILASTLAGGASLLAAKGPYAVFTLAWTATIALAVWRWHRHQVDPRHPTRVAPLLLAGFITVATAMALINANWGGMPALAGTLPPLAGLVVLTALAGGTGRPAVPSALRWQGSVLCAMALIAAMVGIFGGGDYMSGRFATGGKDLEGRRDHWRQGLSLLTTPMDWVFGKGLGRFPAVNYFASTGDDHPGDYRLTTEGANHFMRLSGGEHLIDWGQMLRISQRVSAPVLPVRVQARVRVERDVTLHFEVCEKHLLYNGNCLFKAIGIKAMPGEWQTLVLPLPGSQPSRGTLYAPNLISFSFALAHQKDFAAVDSVALLDGQGRDLLVNGDFENGMAHWFFTSDRIHLPWHIKSMPMNVLFDQGAVGLALFALLFVAALWRVALGSGRGHALAPAAAGALAGFAVVGLFDSLLDAPRIALLFYFILLLALVVQSPRVEPRPV